MASLLFSDSGEVLGYGTNRFSSTLADSPCPGVGGDIEVDGLEEPSARGGMPCLMEFMPP